MKIKDIAKICKGNKTIVTETDKYGTQWIGDGGALYPLLRMPNLDEEGIYAVLDISETQAAGYVYRALTSPGEMCLEDTTQQEIELERGNLTIYYNGRELEPFITSNGLSFIDADYIKPVNGGYTKIFERYTKDGDLYFAIKDGFMLVAVVMPYKVIDDNFAALLETLAQQSKIALQNAPKK